MRLIADLHVHTIASGHAYSTVLEITKAAAEKELSLIALTDHGPAMPGGPHAYHFSNQIAIPEYLFGVRILKGIEANVMDRDGTLDLDEGRLAKLDIVLAGLHTLCAPYGTLRENTDMMIRTMQNPWVDVIVHPGNPEYKIDEEAVVKAAAFHDVALEINNSSLTVSRQGSAGSCSRIARLAIEHGAKLIVGSDSHFALHVGSFEAASALLQKAGFPPEHIINTSTERLLAHLNRRKNRKQWVRI